MNWPMNDNTTSGTVTDYSSGGKNGTNSVNTGTVSAAGELDLALSYAAASSNYTHVADPVGLNTAGYYIFLFWYKTPATLPTSKQGIFSFGNSVNDGNTGLMISNSCTSGPSCTLSGYNGNNAVSWAFRALTAAATAAHAA
jgi:hypothetical protein